MRPFIPMVAVLALTACGSQPLDTFDNPEAGIFRSDTVDEESQYEADMKFFGERREAYEKYGTVPTVPPSLSDDPKDPTYTFDGYADIATEEEAKEHFDRLADAKPTEPGREEAAEEDTPLYEDEVVGTFVNDAGERWSWSPTDLKDRLAERRRDRGHDDDTRSVDDSVQLDDDAELELTRAVLFSDNRNMRSAWSGHNMTAYPWRVIGSLETNGKPTDQNPLGRCTASKIGERYLLTAAHCVYTSGDGAGSLVTRDWWPGADGIDDLASGGDPTPNHYKNVLWYYYSKKFVDDGWETRDYAVLVLYDSDNSCDFGALGYRVDNTLAGTDHWNFGYPWFTKTCPSSSPLAGDDCGGSMWGMEAEIDSTTVSYVFHDHDTDEGQSGSPIYDYNGGNRQIVAHVKGGFSAVDNRGIKMRNRLFDFIESVRDEQPANACTY